MKFTTINNKPFSEQLALRYNLRIANRMANVITFITILAICFIEYLRVTGG